MNYQHLVHTHNEADHQTNLGGTIYPKQFVHRFVGFFLWLSYGRLNDIGHLFGYISQACFISTGKINDCPSASETNLKALDKATMYQVTVNLKQRA